MEIKKISMKDVVLKTNSVKEFTVVDRNASVKKYWKINPPATLATDKQYDYCLVSKKDGVQLFQVRVLPQKKNNNGFSIVMRCPVVHRINFAPWMFQERIDLPQLSYSDWEMKLDFFMSSEKDRLKRANAPISAIRAASSEMEYFGTFVDLFKTEDGIDPSIVYNSQPNIPLALVKCWNEFIVPGVKAGYLVECYSPTDLSGVTRARALMKAIQEFMENTPEQKSVARKPQTLSKGLKVDLSSFFGSSEPEEDVYEDEDVFPEDEDENPPFDEDEEEYEEEEEPEEEKPQSKKVKTKEPTMEEVLSDLANRF